MQKCWILAFQTFFYKLNSGPSLEGILKIKKKIKSTLEKCITNT